MGRKQAKEQKNLPDSGSALQKLGDRKGVIYSQNT